MSMPPDQHRWTSPPTDGLCPPPVARSIRVLLVEDDPRDALLIREYLGAAQRHVFEVEWVTSIQSAFEAIRHTKFDVCLVDYYLGLDNGLDFITSVNENGHRLAGILLTGQASTELDLKTMMVGAADYVLKDELSTVMLEESIRAAIRR